jgi:small GTP-binding protein
MASRLGGIRGHRTTRSKRGGTRGSDNLSVSNLADSLNADKSRLPSPTPIKVGATVNSMTHQNPKVVFCGSAGVGKTTLFKRILERDVDQTSSATMGAACAITHVVVNGQAIPLSLWDTAGQEEYRSLVNLYFRSTAVAVIVFDLTDLDSFEAVGQWCEDLTSNCGDCEPKIIVVGNKLDMRERAVTEDEIDSFVGKMQCGYFEVSALEGTNIDVLFRCIGMTAAQKLRGTEGRVLHEISEPEEKKEGCC